MVEYATVHYRSITGRGARYILAWCWWEGWQLFVVICEVDPEIRTGG